MAWSGGVYTRQITTLSLSGTTIWASVAALGRKIRTDDHDTNDQDLATGINATLAKDGTNAATANLDLGGYKWTNASTTVSARSDLAPVAALQDSAATFAGNSAGTANAMTISPTPAITALANGQRWTFRATTTNTSTTPTLTNTGTAAKTIVNADGSALRLNQIEIGGLYDVIYGSTADQYFLQNFQGVLLVTLADKSAAYTVLTTDIGSIITNKSGTTFAVTLPATSSAGEGYGLDFLVPSSTGIDGGMTLTPATGQMFAGMTTFNLSAKQGLRAMVVDGHWWPSMATPWGDWNGLTAKKATLQDYREAFNSTTITSSTFALNWAAGNNWELIFGISFLISFANPPPSGVVFGGSIKLRQPAATTYGITWPSSVKWPSSTTPTITATAARSDLIVMQSDDGGVSYGAIAAAQNFSGWV